MTTTDKLSLCRTKDTGRSYLVEFDRRTKGLKYLSSGICAACCDCQSNYGYDSPGELERAIVDGLCDEGGISRAGCDCCGNSLQQKLYDGHAFIELNGKEVLTHLDLCEDCVMFIANGDMPQNWEG